MPPFTLSACRGGTYFKFSTDMRDLLPLPFCKDGNSNDDHCKNNRRQQANTRILFVHIAFL